MSVHLDQSMDPQEERSFGTEVRGLEEKLQDLSIRNPGSGYLNLVIVISTGYMNQNPYMHISIHILESSGCASRSLDSSG